MPQSRDCLQLVLITNKTKACRGKAVIQKYHLSIFFSSFPIKWPRSLANLLGTPYHTGLDPLCPNCSWHRFRKVLEPFLRDFSTWPVSITQSLQICWLTWLSGSTTGQCAWDYSSLVRLRSLSNAQLVWRDQKCAKKVSPTLLQHHHQPDHFYTRQKGSMLSCCLH